MSEDKHDDVEPDAIEPDGDAGNDAPPPSTYAGRERTGASKDEESSGLTDEFDGLEAELSADLADTGDPDLISDELALEADEEALSHDEDGPDDADLAEEPPDPVEFEGDEGENDDEEHGEPDDAADESDGNAAPTVVAGETTGATIEVDTLAIADQEAAREAAHAGLRARAETEAARRGHTTTGHPVLAASVATAAESGDDENGAPKSRVWWRFAAATFVIIASVAAATSISFLLFLNDIAEGLGDGGAFNNVKGALEDVEPGAPQTIMILGSDKRSGTPGDPGRSDTTLLLRVDPEKGLLSLLSLPRDLEVEIPNYGTDKLNAAYSYGEQAKEDGGPELALKTVKELLDIPINHVVNVDFTGFYEAVNAIDCVYIDVDREYFNVNDGTVANNYAAIDVPAGYSKLCGYTALQYVRYRHEDNDLVRGARQQDFVREARQRIPPRQLLPVFGAGNELIEIFTKYTTSDIDDVATIIDMLETFITVRDAEVRQVDLGQIVADGGVEATQDQVDEAVAMFLGSDLDKQPAEPEPAEDKPKKDKPKDKPDGESAPSLIDATGAAEAYAVEFEKYLKARKAKLPVLHPTGILSQSQILDDSRAYRLSGIDDKVVYEGYKYVMTYPESGFTSYYGLNGVNWLDPPILENPSETRNIDGRNYLLFFQAGKLRLVGWKTDQGSYWVNNTLTQALSEDEMLAIATDVREFKG